ncbi:hypothetical protein GR158_24230 [Shinella sp. AETb1-6]|uniref:hypothetical protein n=1 Tax=Shinella sp. AETb1-6 TaxID=2692210 RepID=UPI001368B6B6|nr:hypothetical protein [Shinella sp. AETb1-6]MXN54212.1 hypothetical protein [Shinella sp. AETb1-6]
MKIKFISAALVISLAAGCTKTENRVDGGVKPSNSANKSLQEDGNRAKKWLETYCDYYANINDVIQVIELATVGTERWFKISKIICDKVKEKRSKSLSNVVNVEVNGVTVRGTVK